MATDYLSYVPGFAVGQKLGLDPAGPANTAAQGAANAQAQANQLSALQWQRQMTGLQGALGYVGGLQSLYNSIYSPGGGRAAPGGATVAQPMPAGAALAGNLPTQATNMNQGANLRAPTKYDKYIDSVPAIGALNRVREGNYGKAAKDLIPGGGALDALKGLF